ncbi:MAG: arginine--tRNA ligase, partial [Woeseiaceae bacterium]|nr:arginine--tRNA ligase [Woeseiaceae bacterium]
MKQIVTNLISQALKTLPELTEIAADLSLESTVERTRDASHGDFASNIAMRLAKSAGKSPREIASNIIKAINDNDQITNIEIAGPGFINFHLSPSAFHAELETILSSDTKYGQQTKKNTPKILLEFISANPTGPLH